VRLNKSMAHHITPKELQDSARAMDGYGIRTLDDLRRCIAKDVDNNILWLSKQTNVKHSLLVMLLMAEFEHDDGLSSKRKLRGYWCGLITVPSMLRLFGKDMARVWSEQRIHIFLDGPRQGCYVVRQLVIRQRRLWYNRRRHWPDALVLLILPLLLVFLALRAQSINNRSVPYVTVPQGVAIAAFTKPTDNLALTNVPYAKGAFTSIDQVRGRYALVNLPAGSTLSSDQLLSSDLSTKMANRSILSVPIRTGGYVSTMKAPCEAIMVLSPRKEDGNGFSGASFSVIVLRIDGTGEATSATVAIQKDDVDKASALLASHDVFLAQGSG
jgi:hypothetical protein